MTVTSTIDVTGAGTGTALMTMLNAGDIEPGSDVSYQLCKVIYLYHPLGGKMVDRPIKIAQSQGRDIAIPDGPEELARDAFERENISQTPCVPRASMVSVRWLTVRPTSPPTSRSIRSPFLIWISIFPRSTH